MYHLLLCRLPDAKIETYDARVTAMLLQPPPSSNLWLGLGSGYLLVINAVSHTPLIVTQRHVGAIRCLKCVTALVEEKKVYLILSGGFGFLQRPGYQAPSKGDLNSLFGITKIAFYITNLRI